jgi:hypothetical protein
MNDCAVLTLLQDLWSKVDGMVSQRRSFPFNRGGGAATTTANGALGQILKIFFSQ